MTIECIFQPTNGETSPPAASAPVPASPAVEPSEPETLPKYKRDLAAKARALRAELQALQPQTGHCRIEVGCCSHLLLFANVFTFSKILKYREVDYESFTGPTLTGKSVREIKVK